MRVAVVGTGISGNAAAYALSTHPAVQRLAVYEKDLRPGGHAATVDINYLGTPITVDTGFIVYNELNYPLLTRLFAHLGVATKESDMGFSVSRDGGRHEWAGKTVDYVNGFFAKRRNVLSAPHWRMLLEIMRFGRVCAGAIGTGRVERESLGGFIARHGFSQRFRQDYILPMGAAIWSTPRAHMLDFPAESFIRFFNNHRLLHWNRPVWRTVEGGSRVYVERMVAAYRRSLHLGAAVTGVRRVPGGVEVKTAAGGVETYDHVVIAAHSDQALAMLSDAGEAERAVLGAVRYRANSVYLHRDPAFMPRRRAAWTAWNVTFDSDDPDDGDLAVTYWMNALQGIDERFPLFVSLNPPKPPRDDMVFARFSYDHPQFDGPAIDAQRELGAIQGRGGVWFAGAWTGYGFHEDGLRSGLEIAAALGAPLPWEAAGPQLREAAE
jgi:predicted NAD/FAD-binding protein